MAQRNFATKFKSGASEAFGQGAIDDDEFLPDREELEMRIREEMDASLTIATRADSQLKHNEEVGGVIFKYDLPTANTPISFKNAAALIAVEEELESTPTMNLFDELDCDKDTAFESFIIKHHSTFNNEVDMYGDI